MASEPLESPLWRTAIHEAGHCVADRWLGIEIGGTTIVEGPDYDGLTWGPRSVRALRGKDNMQVGADDVTARIAEAIARELPGPGEERDGSAIFAAVQIRITGLMAGGAAELVILGDRSPQFIASDLASAHTLARIICRSEASRVALVEHAFEEARAVVNENATAVEAIAQALIAHPEKTLDAREIDLVIAKTLAREAFEAERERRRHWRRVLESAASFKPER